PEVLSESVAASRAVRLKFEGINDHGLPGVHSPAPVYRTLPMTNCAQVWGNGPIPIVGMRNKSEMTASSLVQQVEGDRGGFAATVPYAMYQEKFSYFVDAAPHNLDIDLAKFKEMFDQGNPDSTLISSIMNDITS